MGLKKVFSPVVEKLFNDEDQLQPCSSKHTQTFWDECRPSRSVDAEFEFRQEGN